MNIKLAVSTAVVLVAAAISGSAQASIIPILATVSPDGSNFKFTYDGQLATDQGVKAGNELVIIDFAGYVPGTVFSPYSNVSASISNTLPAGLLLNPGFTDNPLIPDLVFTYTGPDFETSGGPYPTLTTFAGLSADSTFSRTTVGSFSAVAVKNNGDLVGTATYNVGQISVPTAVPEPAVWAMMIAVFGAVGFMMRGSRKNTNLAVTT
jgi:hypothetical protein